MAASTSRTNTTSLPLPDVTGTSVSPAASAAIHTAATAARSPPSRRASEATSSSRPCWPPGWPRPWPGGVAQQAVEASQHRGVERREVQLRVPLAAEAVAGPQALARAQVGAGVVGDDVVADRQRHPDRQPHQHGQGDLFAVSQPPQEGADARDPGHLAAQGSQPRAGAQSGGSTRRSVHRPASRDAEGP